MPRIQRNQTAPSAGRISSFTPITRPSRSKSDLAGPANPIATRTAAKRPRIEKYQTNPRPTSSTCNQQLGTPRTGLEAARVLRRGRAQSLVAIPRDRSDRPPLSPFPHTTPTHPNDRESKITKQTQDRPKHFRIHNFNPVTFEPRSLISPLDRTPSGCKKMGTVPSSDQIRSLESIRSAGAKWTVPDVFTAPGPRGPLDTLH